MAYVSGPFVHDIFLSYGHGRSDGAAEPRLKRWSLAFASELEVELQQFDEITVPVSMYRDQSPRPEEGLRPNGSIADQLKLNCNAALLVTLVSPWYLKSKWCEAEREWWANHQAQLQRSPDRSVYADQNVFVVHVWHMAEVPAELRGSEDAPVGMLFYDRQRAKLEPQPFEWPEPTPASRDPFRKHVVKLAGWIKTRLIEIHKQQEARKQAQDANRRLVGGRRVVYLYGRDEYRDDWRRAYDALAAADFVVFPDEPERDHANDAKRILKARDERLKTLRGCDALLLVSPRRPEEVDADIAAIGRSDRLAALTQSTRPLPCALIDTVGGSISTPNRRARALIMSVEWIDATRVGDDGWVERVGEWLVRIGEVEAAL